MLFAHATRRPSLSLQSDDRLATVQSSYQLSTLWRSLRHRDYHAVVNSVCRKTVEQTYVFEWPPNCARNSLIRR